MTSPLEKAAREGRPDQFDLFEQLEAGGEGRQADGRAGQGMELREPRGPSAVAPATRAAPSRSSSAGRAGMD